MEAVKSAANHPLPSVGRAADVLDSGAVLLENPARPH
jgi:hypothetical protein